MHIFVMLSGRTEALKISQDSTTRISKGHPPTESLLVVMLFLVVLLLVVLLVPMTSTPGSLGTLPESVLKLPVRTSTVPRPALEVSRELLALAHLFVGGVPSGFETREEGIFLRGVAVVGPKVIVVGYDGISEGTDARRSEMAWYLPRAVSRSCSRTSCPAGVKPILSV